MSQVDAWHSFTSSNFQLESLWHLLLKTFRNIVIQIEQYTKETVEHLIIAVITYIIVCILLFLAITKWRLIRYNKTEKRPETNRILLITAHPDDECMFFGPTILHYTRQPSSTVHLMCLSTGANYGMGKKRKEELYQSCKILGIEPSHITTLNHTNLPDQIDVRWPIDTLARLILQQIEAYSIDTIITFDKNGVSRHLNHSSIYYAIAHLSIEKKLPKNCSVYVLETVNLIRKYWLLLDIPIAFVLSRTRYLVAWADRKTIHSAMRAHQSQLVWFRRLYMVFSRYMLLNSLQKMNISDIELDLEVDD